MLWRDETHFVHSNRANAPELLLTRTFLGAFAKFRKAIISFVMSGCLFVHMEQQLGSHWTDFHDSWYFRIFPKTFDKIQVSLKIRHKWQGLCMATYVHLWCLAEFVFERDMFQTKVVDQAKQNLWFFSENPAVYEMWKNTAELDKATDDNRIRRMRTACWISKDTNTLIIFSTYCYFTATMVTRYMWIAPLVQLIYLHNEYSEKKTQQNTPYLHIN